MRGKAYPGRTNQRSAVKFLALGQLPPLLFVKEERRRGKRKKTAASSQFS
jgi:hypothetical protein